MRESPAYTLDKDPVHPKRRFILRADTGGVVHWSLEEMLEKPGAVAWCEYDSGAQLVVFFRGANRYDYPTCFWCMSTPARRARKRSLHPY